MSSTRLRAAAACALLFACGPSTKPAPEPPPAEPAKPVATDKASEAKPPAPEKPTPEQLMAQTLARAVEIQEVVARLRELKFKKEVPAERQSREDFSKYVRESLAKELPKDESARISKALFHMGFLTDKIDLGDSMALAFTSQAAAYYDPESGKFYAVSLSSDLNWLEIMTAHELTHGLQDQHFDLRAYYGEKPRMDLSEDQLNARRFVVEGEASFVMFLHMFGVQTRSDNVEKLAAQTAVALKFMVASMSWQQLVESSKQQASKIDGIDAAQLEALDKIPPFILVPMLESYLGGAVAISKVYETGGWKAVSALYADPPDSTEQVLHPDKLLGDRDLPTVITLPSLAAKHGKPLFEETLGELGWRVYLETWKVAGAKEAAAGWDGDRSAVYQTKSGPVAITALTFDTPKDAREFEAAFAESVARRFPKGAVKGDSGTFKRADNGNVLVSRRKSDVYIVDSADARSARRVLAQISGKTTTRPLKK